MDKETRQWLANLEANQRYFLRTVGTPWHEVSKEDFVRAERAVGFYPKGIDVGQPATGGFSGGAVEGRTVYTNHVTAKSYAWDEDFNKILFPELYLTS